MVILLVVKFIASDGDFGGVDHNHVVAAVEMSAVTHFSLAHYGGGQLCAQAAQGLAGSVHQVPFVG